MLAQRDVVFSRGLWAMKHRIRSLRIELALPTGDHNGSYSVANNVGDGTHLGEEPIDAKKKGNAGYRYRPQCGERGGQGDKAATRDGCGTFRIQHENEEDKDLLSQREVGVGGLSDEEQGNG